MGRDDIPAIVKKYPYCPLIKGEKYFGQCKMPVNRFHFIQICNTRNYERCIHYGKIKNQLLRPMGWLQKVAVEKEEPKNV